MSRYSRDPTSAPRQPANTRGMWRCDECGAANDPESDRCETCGEVEPRC